MKTKDFICNCLGLYDSACNKIDEICSNFGIDITGEEVDVIFNNLDNSRSFGNAIISDCYDKIIRNAVEKLGADETLFEKDVNDYCSYLFYNDDSIYTWRELEELIESINE